MSKWENIAFFFLFGFPCVVYHACDSARTHKDLKKPSNYDYYSEAPPFMSRLHLRCGEARGTKVGQLYSTFQLHTSELKRLSLANSLTVVTPHVSLRKNFWRKMLYPNFLDVTNHIRWSVFVFQRWWCAIIFAFCHLVSTSYNLVASTSLFRAPGIVTELRVNRGVFFILAQAKARSRDATMTGKHMFRNSHNTTHLLW